MPATFCTIQLVLGKPGEKKCPIRILSFECFFESGTSLKVSIMKDRGELISKRKKGS
jgi:hypothetical protein